MKASIFYGGQRRVCGAAERHRHGAVVGPDRGRDKAGFEE